MKVAQWAQEAKSDGCTMAKDIYLPACWEHDFHCVYHKTMYGDHISSAEAAARFKQVIQMLSPAKKWSIIAHVRWAAVRIFGPQWD